MCMFLSRVNKNECIKWAILDISKTVEVICKYLYRELSTKCDWQQLNASWKRQLKHRLCGIRNYIKLINKVNTYSSSVMVKKQSSHTRTSYSNPSGGIVDFLALHLLHTALPHFLQWCWKNQKSIQDNKFNNLIWLSFFVLIDQRIEK